MDREEEQAKGQKLQTAISFGATLLGAFTGRKLASTGNLGRATTAARGVSRSVNQAGDVARAKQTLATLQQARADLDLEFSDAVTALEAELDASHGDFDQIELRPKKADVRVRFLALTWMPVWRDASGEERPAWR